jgi:hypothetical protein
MGYMRPLPHGPVGRDEAFNSEAYNIDSINFLGITRDRFEAVAYEAVLHLPTVMAYPDALTPLVQRFSASCFQLYDGVTVFGNILTEDDLLDAIDGYRAAGDENRKDK